MHYSRQDGNVTVHTVRVAGVAKCPARSVQGMGDVRHSFQPTAAPLPQVDSIEAVSAADEERVMRAGAERLTAKPQLQRPSPAVTYF